MLRITLAPQALNAPDWAGLPRWMSALLTARGIAAEDDARQFLHPSLDQLHPPEALHQLRQAAELLRAAASQGKRAVIYGDYDVDGVSASAILYEALGTLGMERQVYLPDRHKEGYGLNLSAVEALAREAEVLVTVDCGITSVEEVRRAKELGMTVIVTDHHRHLEALPPADAVVSPLLGNYPFPSLCGAGVAWKLSQALIGEKALALLEIAALATVADLVPLTGENRVIVALGLEKLSATRRPGLVALMRRAGIQGRISSDQVAFQLAPRMNACGRMESARTALDMLLTRDTAQAEALALKMEGLNQERKNQEAKVLTEALAQAGQMDLVETKAIVVWGEGWNSGVVGLAAGRVAEKFAYPTVALSVEGDVCVGSARSAGEIDIYKALSQCADLFDRFGGHRQAAGLTLKKARVPEFAARLSRAVAEQTGGRPVEPQVVCDGALSLSEVTEETVALLAQLEPFGMGNPAPRFLCDDVQPLSLRAVGAEGRHLKCAFRQGNELRDGIYFGGGALAGQTQGRCRLAFSPTINEFRGRISVECRVHALEMIPESLQRDETREALALFSDALSGGEEAPPLPAADLSALETEGQGTLLLCRCLDTALNLRRRFPKADFCLEAADDPRAFNAILLCGGADRVSPAFRRIIFCDGEMGESAAYARLFPKARFSALPLSQPLRRLLAAAFLERDGLRQCYQQLRRQPGRNLYDFAALCGIPPMQGAFALRVLKDIGLIDFSLSPFQASLLAMRRRDPEESALYRLARREKEESDGLHSI